MNALTYELRSAAAAVRAAQPAAPAKKGFWARFLDSLIEARMREAERQLRTHARYIPEDVLEAAGIKRTLAEADKLPFVK